MNVPLREGVNRLARLHVRAEVHDDAGNPVIAATYNVTDDADPAESPYVIAELLRGMLRDVGESVYAQARAIALSTTTPKGEQ